MEKNVLKIYGIEWYLFVFFAAAVLISVYFGIVPNQLIGAIAVMFTFGIILGEIGERLPIWNKYCGGGAILAFLVCGFFTFKGWMPEGVIAISKGWMNDYNFLNVFIALLVVGSLLGLDRDMLIKPEFATCEEKMESKGLHFLLQPCVFFCIYANF